MRMLVAGGGTGGHLFPGMALAEELVSRSKGNFVSFVGTSRGIEARVVPEKGFELDLVAVKPLRGGGLRGLLAGIFALPAAIIESIRILRRRKPDVVVGVGGYASGPAVLAAWLMRIPRVICEQNTIPGTTSRILGRMANIIFIAFEQSAGYFPAGRSVFLGNPVRRALLDNYLQSKVPTPKFSVLAFGGSQGAHVLNMAVVDALRNMGPERDGVSLVHQTGKADLEEARGAYREMGFEAKVIEFIDDMADAYRRSDLVICRAGATSVAELGVCRKPSVLVPFPYATDDHQTKNAEAMAGAGAAVVIRQESLTGERLARVIAELKSDPERLKAMEAAAGAFGRPQAAKECVDCCFELIRRRG